MNRVEKIKLFETLGKDRNKIIETIKEMYHDGREDDDEWVAGILDMVAIYYEKTLYVKVFRMFVDEGFDWLFYENINSELFYEFYKNDYAAKMLSYQDEKDIIKRHFFAMYKKRNIPKRFEYPGEIDFVLIDYVAEYEKFIKRISYASGISERFLVFVGKETSEVKKALELYSQKFNVNFGTIYRVLDGLRTELVLAKMRYDNISETKIEESMKLVFEFYKETWGDECITLEDFMTIYDNVKREVKWNCL